MKAFKVIIIILSVIGIVVLAIGGLYMHVGKRAGALPENRPEQFIKKMVTLPGGTRAVVCIGDSITHGSVSSNYVDLLSERLGDKGYAFINAGVNGELSYNALKRIDPIIRCNPDYVCILIGTNDVIGAWIHPGYIDRYMKEKSIPRPPAKDWFIRNTTEMCKRLKKETKARIAILSLPVLTENPHLDGYKLTVEYSMEIKKIAEREGITYIPINEFMREHITDHRSSRSCEWRYFDGPEFLYLMWKAIVERYALGRDWDRIASGNGLVLLTDLVHLNDRAAGMVADRIESFITGTETE